MSITPIYAALLGILFCVLSLNVVRARRAAGIGLGDGGDATLSRRIRAHGNFAEYVPLSLILILLIEEAGANPTFVHGINIALLAGRIMHAIALSSPTPRPLLRTAGAALSILVVAASSIRLLVLLV